MKKPPTTTPVNPVNRFSGFTGVGDRAYFVFAGRFTGFTGVGGRAYLFFCPALKRGLQ